MPVEAKALPMEATVDMFMSHYKALCHKNLWDKSLFDTLKDYISYTAQTKPQQLKVGLAYFLQTPLGEIGAEPEAVICWLSWHRHDFLNVFCEAFWIFLKVSLIIAQRLSQQFLNAVDRFLPLPWFLHSFFWSFSNVLWWPFKA